MKKKWAVVQHSGYGYAFHYEFKQGLELRGITKAAEERLVQQAGGIVFDEWDAADEYCMREMYPDDEGFAPHAEGGFSDKTIDGLRIYQPGKRERR